VGSIVERARAANQGFPFDVTIEYCADSDRVAALLEQEFDIIQFIGHIAECGFETTDGYLAVDDLDELGVKTFVLNGCTSVTHGEQLLERGAVAGIVTIQDIVGVGAERAGVHLGRSLAHGYTFRGAQYLLEQVSPYARAYTLVGDGGARINQRDTVPSALDINRVDDEFRVRATTLPTTAVGARFDPALGTANRDRLIGQETQAQVVSEDTLATLLSAVPDCPVIMENQLYWAEELAPGEGVLQHE
jgi:hypothetical protein